MSPSDARRVRVTLTAVLLLLAPLGLVQCKFIVETEGRACNVAAHCPGSYDCVSQLILEQQQPGLCVHTNCCVKRGSAGAPCMTDEECDDGGICRNRTCLIADGPVVEICNNNRDDDGDGRRDCLDPDCAGRVCDAQGNVCLGNECRCEGGDIEVCNDGADNDCDGLIDCEDVGSCNGQACGMGRSMCVGNRCQCLNGEPPEVICTDDVDNDCDGRINCADPDCMGRPCDRNQPFHRCDEAGECSELVGGERDCKDGADNDLDGATDCADSDCLQSDCSPPGRVGMTCQVDESNPAMPTVCECPGGGSSIETACGDGMDNDCDGLTDCTDVLDCPEEEVCKPNTADATSNWICRGETCRCPRDTPVEDNCFDDIDNDCNFFVDCFDPACFDKPCAEGFLCNSETGDCNIPAE